MTDEEERADEEKEQESRDDTCAMLVMEPLEAGDELALKGRAM